jgi:hypothetical protein
MEWYRRSQPRRAAEPSESRARWWGLVVISLGVSLIIVDTTIVNVAIPSDRIRIRYRDPRHGSVRDLGVATEHRIGEAPADRWATDRLGHGGQGQRRWNNSGPRRRSSHRASGGRRANGAYRCDSGCSAHGGRVLGSGPGREHVTRPPHLHCQGGVVDHAGRCRAAALADDLTWAGRRGPDYRGSEPGCRRTARWKRRRW